MEEVQIIGSYVHGSADSIDKDVVYLLDRIPEFNECKMFCASLEGNPNIIYVEDGIVKWCYKGSEDEVNNGLFYTIPLHDENKDNPIKRPVERDLCLKLIRAVRGIISHLSRSQYREAIKRALRGEFEGKLDVIENLDLMSIDFDSLNHNMRGCDILKLIAFQIGQSLALIEGKELFTKREISEYMPVLKQFLYRDENPDIQALEASLMYFVKVIRGVGIVDCGERIVEYNGNRYDMKMEQKI